MGLEQTKDDETDEEDDMVGYIGGKVTFDDDDDDGKMEPEMETITSNLSSLLVIM